MSKAPADQFYWADWLRDHQLQQTSPLVRGIWANVLAHAWFADERGRVTGSMASLARLGNCSVDEFEVFLEEAGLYGFCDMSRAVTNGHEIITITNRRQYREWQRKDKERAQAAERKRLQRERDKSREVVTPKSQDVTIPSASSSSSACPKGHKSSPKQVSHDTLRIYEHWQSKSNLIKHRNLADQRAKHINARLKECSVEEVCEAIDNYDSILGDADYLLDYKWKIEEFMTRSLEKFLSENDPFTSYPKHRDSQGAKPHGECCGTCSHGNPKKATFCGERMKTVLPDDSPCPKYEEQA